VAARPVIIPHDRVAPVVLPRDEGAEAEEDFASLGVKRFPPWLIIAAVHVLLITLLGIIVLAGVSPERVDLLAGALYAESLGEQLEFDSPLAGNDPDNVEEPGITPLDMPPVEDPFAAPADSISLPADCPLAGPTAWTLPGSGPFVERMRERLQDRLPDGEVPAAGESRVGVRIEEGGESGV